MSHDVDHEDATERHSDDPSPGGPAPCDEPDCRYVTAEPSDEAGIGLAASDRFPAFSTDAATTLSRGCTVRPAGLPNAVGRQFPAQPLRAQSQVWRL
ncbi:MAG: hypothetical protein R3C19_10345 [Planctomycetaceae bacterium]